MRQFLVLTNKSSINTANLQKSFGNQVNSINTNSIQLSFVNHGNSVNTAFYHNFVQCPGELGTDYLITNMKFVWHQRQHTIRQLYPIISLFGIDGNTTCHSTMKFGNKIESFSLLYFTLKTSSLCSNLPLLRNYSIFSLLKTSPSKIKFRKIWQ